jgi:hypothetical protein
LLSASLTNGPRFTSTRSSLSTKWPMCSSNLSDISNLITYSYEVEFSKPHPLKPIPEGTVKVFFALIELADGQTAVEFNFENESLRHQLDNTMRTNMFEVR